jgi:hypothetical protein
MDLLPEMAMQELHYGLCEEHYKRQLRREVHHGIDWNFSPY